jgi:hypothetical protein
VRYPSYLCVGWHDYYGIRNCCRGDCSVYRYFSVHAKDPYRVLEPTRRLRSKVTGYTEVARSGRWKDEEPAKLRRRVTSDAHSRAVKPMKKSRGERPVQQTRSVGRTKMVGQTKVVRSSKDSFVRARKDITVMRRQLKQRNVQKTMAQSKVNKTRQRKDSHKALARKDNVKRDAKMRKVSKKTRNTRAHKSSKSVESSRGKAKSSRKVKHGTR